MAQPQSYTRLTDFSDEESRSVSGRSTVRTSALDAELDNIATSLNQVVANLKIIQRSDDKLADAVVEPHTFNSASLLLMGSKSWSVKGQWASSTSYSVGDLVEYSGESYVCSVAHTSSANFTADDAAGYWVQVSKNQSASSTSFSPTTTISSSTVQTAIEEVDNELRPLVMINARETLGGL